MQSGTPNQSSADPPNLLSNVETTPSDPLPQPLIPSHAHYPAPLSEGTGLYISPFSALDNPSPSQLRLLQSPPATFPSSADLISRPHRLPFSAPEQQSEFKGFPVDLSTHASIHEGQPAHYQSQRSPLQQPPTAPYPSFAVHNSTPAESLLFSTPSEQPLFERLPPVVDTYTSTRPEELFQGTRFCDRIGRQNNEQKPDQALPLPLQDSQKARLPFSQSPHALKDGRPQQLSFSGFQSTTAFESTHSGGDANENEADGPDAIIQGTSHESNPVNAIHRTTPHAPSTGPVIETAAKAAVNPELSLSFPRREFSSSLPTDFSAGTPGASSLDPVIGIPGPYPTPPPLSVWGERDLSKLHVVRDKSQASVSLINPPLSFENNAELSLSKLPLGAFQPLQQPKALNYRGQMNSTGIPPQVDSSTPQFPYADGPNSNTQSGFSGPASLRDSNTLSHPTTLRTSVDAQSTVHQPVKPTVPLLGRPPSKRKAEVYVSPPTIAQGSSASQGYERIQPRMNIPNQFLTSSPHGNREIPITSLTAMNNANMETAEGRIFSQRSQSGSPRVQNSHPDSADDRARVIYHPRGDEVNGAICRNCNKIFKTEKDMQRHVQRMHVMRGRYPCPHAPCKQSFAEAHKLSRHVRTVHLMNRPFKCTHCDSAFGERGNMLQHLRKAHLGEARDPKKLRRN